MQEESLKSIDSSFDDKNLNNIKEEKNNKPSIKILVGYHKPAVLLKDEILTPIHLGRALATESSKDGKLSQEDYEWMCENMIGDDTGDNISHLNRYFCELTGIYWAWKNYDKLGNPDYIGFMHYRRQFLFDENHEPKWDIFNRYNNKYFILKKDYDKKLAKLLDEYDVLVAYKASFAETVEEQYKNCPFHTEKDFDDLKQFVKEKHSKDFNVFNDYINGHEAYFANMFIMKKDLFFRYCEFLFGICFGIHKNLNYKDRDSQTLRAVGFLSETVTGFYYKKILKEQIKFLELPIGLILDTKLEKDLKPAFKTNNIAVVFSCNNNYLDYLGVALQSMMEHSSDENNYDIIVLDDDLNFEYKDRLLRQCKRKNFSLRFVNISLHLNIDKLADIFYIGGGHYDISVYYRFFLAEILRYYDRCLYLDADIIIREDISKLYNTDLKGHIIGATKDIYIKILGAKYKSWAKYLNKTIKIDDANPYFQAGVLLFDLDKFRKEDILKKLLYNLEYILKKPKLQDQCTLNYTLKTKVCFIDNRWNFDLNIQEDLVKQNPFILAETLNKEYIKNYEDARSNPFIIHYAGPAKPWNSPHIEKADIWWSYARKTSFYEEILYKNSPMPYKAGAVNIIKSHLSYKLGKEILSVKNNKLKILLLPLSIPWTYILHFTSKAFNNLLASSNGLIKPEPMHHYSDYHQALRIKDKHLSYRLGNLLVKHPFTFIFRANKVYKEWRREKDR